MDNLILIGFKRSGKTTLGKELATVLNRSFIDTDDLIAEDCHRCYKEVGEEAFRLLEKQAIFTLISAKKSVIATGGGTLLDPENISVLKKIGTLIYIYVPKEELKKRLLRKPLPAFLELESFEEMFEKRSSIFETVADIIYGK